LPKAPAAWPSGDLAHRLGDPRIAEPVRQVA